MQNAHKRKKQPELVKQALIDNAIKIAIEQGLKAVTVQSVADASGVTKGGFMHHFASKQALIDFVFQSLMASFNQKIEELISQDTIEYGCFTRAYLKASVDFSEDKDNAKRALFHLMVGEASLQKLWKEWFDEKIKQHTATDSSDFLILIQLAVDGLWFAEITALNFSDKTKLLERLIAFTYPAPAK